MPQTAQHTKVQKLSSMYFEKDTHNLKESVRGLGGGGGGGGEEEDDDDDLNDLCYLHQAPISCTNLVAKTKLNSIRTYNFIEFCSLIFEMKQMAATHSS